jgi:hypothetical protein
VPTEAPGDGHLLHSQHVRMHPRHLRTDALAMAVDSAVADHIAGPNEHGYLAEANAERLGTVSIDKSRTRFRRLDDLDIDVAGELARRAADLVAAGRFAM